MKLYKLYVQVRVVEQALPEDSAEDKPPSADPAERDREELGGASFNRELLGMMRQAFKGGFSKTPAGPPASAGIMRTFDMPAESFDDALGNLKQITDVCLKLGLPSSAAPDSNNPPFGPYSMG